MNEKQAAEIDALMKQHDTRTGKLGDDERAQAEFAAEFGRVSRETIKPTMEQVVEKLRTAGHHAAVAEAIRKTGADSDRPHAIRLEILPADVKRESYAKNELPGITFSAEAGMKVVVVSRSGRPDAEHATGPRRRFRLSEITPEMITEEIVEVLKRTF